MEQFLLNTAVESPLNKIVDWIVREWFTSPLDKGLRVHVDGVCEHKPDGYDCDNLAIYIMSGSKFCQSCADSCFSFDY